MCDFAFIEKNLEIARRGRIVGFPRPWTYVWRKQTLHINQMIMIIITLGARALVPGHRHKMVLCSDTGTTYVDMFTFNKPSTCPLHFESVRIASCMHSMHVYLLDYRFLRFLYLFHVVFLYETLKRPNGLRRQATITANCYGNLRLFCFVLFKEALD